MANVRYSATPVRLGVQSDLLGALTDSQVDRPGGVRCQRNGDHFAALAGDGERSVSALDAQGLDAGPVASETRSPFKASREMSACSAAAPGPAIHLTVNPSR